MSELRKQTRVEQTISEVERLLNEFGGWKEKRDKADEKQQNQTQLQALDTVVKKAVGDIHGDVGEILKDNPSLGTVYEKCTLQERRLLWVRRVLWGYYRRKFDQRDQSDELKQLLEAADDVVWSCYKEALGKDLKPVPMAYIEPFFSPLARPRDKPQGLLTESWPEREKLEEKRLGTEFLSELFTELPIPLVSLPPACLVAPWWLVYLGHEVGHHVQHDLDLVKDFGMWLKDVAMSSDVEPKEKEIQASRWYNWGQEIFADTFSVYMMGGAAAWAMAELETHQDQFMAERKDGYPSPAARLALLARLAAKLKVKGSDKLLAADPSESLISDPGLRNVYRESLKADRDMLGKMALALTGEPKTDLGTLASLAGWAPNRFAKLTGWASSRFAETGEVRSWQNSLAQPTFEKYSPSRQAARLIVSAAVEEWRCIIGRDEEEWRKIVSQDVARWGSVATAEQVAEPGVVPELRRLALGQLAQKLLAAIAKNRDVTTRAAAPEILVKADDIAAEVSKRLREAEFVEW